MRGTALVTSIFLIAAVGGPVAHAQSAAAEAEFVKGKKLLGEGKVQEACAAFERSQQIEPLSGTLYNLALCYEQAGKTASAWLRFREIAQTDTNAARRKASAKKAAALESRLTKLLITVRVQVEGMRVLRNDVEVTNLIGIEDPVDPGKYRVAASAEGYKPVQLDVEVAGPGTTITVEVPRLEKAAVGKQGQPEQEDEEYEDDRGGGGSAPGRGRVIAGIATASAGVVAIGVGVVFGVKARSTWSDVEELCGDDLACDTQADYDRSRDLTNEARRDGNLSTILIGAGVAVAAGGAYLWLTAPRGSDEESEALRLVPQLGSDVTGVALTGGF